MPHKQKRKRRADQDKAHFDLPPSSSSSSRATALGVRRKAGKKDLFGDDGDGDGKGRSKKRQRRGGAGSGKNLNVIDDTPKRFARLMAFQSQGKRLRSGLDDGVEGRAEKKVKRKEKMTGSSMAAGEGVVAGAAADEPRSKANEASAARARPSRTPALSSAATVATSNGSGVQLQTDTPPSDAAKPLKILPGERLSAFALRVDQSLPLSSVPRHSTKETVKIPGLKTKQNLTKHNKKLLRMQEQWREEEKKRREKNIEREEELEDKKEEEGLLWDEVERNRVNRKGKRRKGGDGGDDEGGDIWKALERKREDTNRGKVLTVGDAVKEPPKLGRVKSVFKESGRRRVVGVS